ncbi:MAG: bile acid:sodium symporter [Pirellulales bacterium]|nr:bile acid:sodium symporter [Pirellulales bacterium]
MASARSSTSPPATPLARWGATLHHYFLPILAAVYVLAGLAPGPGAAIREYPIPLIAGHETHAPMLLVALLLFCAAAVIDLGQIREVVERPSVLLGALLSGWLAPALAVALLGVLLPRLFETASTSGLLVGLALVAAMPVANSAAGWTQNAGGNVALALGLIVLSILISPLATPQMLNVMGFALSESETAQIERVVAEFSGWKFIVWVILPSLAGALVAWLAGRERIARLKPIIRLTTLVDILVLNYANGSLAARQIWQEEQWATLAAAVAIGASIAAIGVAVGLVLAKLWRLGRPSRDALLFALSMKHTGLALVLAGQVLAEHPRVILVIMMATLLQHVSAGLIDWRLERRASSAAGT